MPSRSRGPKCLPGKVEAQRYYLAQGPGRGRIVQALTTLPRASDKHTQPTETPTGVGATSRSPEAAVGAARLRAGFRERRRGVHGGGSPLPSILEPTSSVGELWSRANASGNHPWIDGRGSNEPGE